MCAGHIRRHQNSPSGRCGRLLVCWRDGVELASRSEEHRRNPRPMRVSVSQALHGAIISFLSHLNGPAIQVREFPERSTATPAVFTKSAPVPPTPTRRAKGPAIFPILLQDSSMRPQVVRASCLTGVGYVISIPTPGRSHPVVESRSRAVG